MNGTSYLVIGTTTSTIVFATVISGLPTEIPSVTTLFVTTLLTPSYLPETTTVPLVTTVPGTTTVVETVITPTAPGGQPLTTVVTSTVPERITTTNVPVTLKPGESYVITSGLVTSTIPNVETRTTTVTLPGGKVVPSVYVTAAQRIETKTSVYTNTAGQVVTSTYTTTAPPGPPKVQTQTKVFTDAAGNVVTSTYMTTLTPGMVTVYSTAWGTVVGGWKPEPTGSSDNSATTVTVLVVGISYGQYVAGAILPTLFAVIIALPLRVLDVNAKLFQPFVTLASSDANAGASAGSSVFLRYYGWSGLVAVPRANKRLGQPVVLVCGLVLVGSTLLAPIAAEAVSIHVLDGCAGSCRGWLSIDPLPGRVLQVILSLMVAALVGLLVLLLFGFYTGVRHNPWSIAGMAALGLDQQFKSTLKDIPRGLGRKVEDSEVAEVLARKKFWLGTDPSNGKYGIQVSAVPIMPSERLLTTSGRKDKAPDTGETLAGRTRIMSFSLLTWWARALMLLLFTMVLIILLYYQHSSGDTGFERFVDSQGKGVRFFFTAIGVALGFLFGNFFRCKSFVMSCFSRAQLAHMSFSYRCGAPISISSTITQTSSGSALHLGFSSHECLLRYLGCISPATSLSRLTCFRHHSGRIPPSHYRSCSLQFHGDI
jgi:hypothetical protein